MLVRVLETTEFRSGTSDESCGLSGTRVVLLAFGFGVIFLRDLKRDRKIAVRPVSQFLDGRACVAVFAEEVRCDRKKT